MRFPHERQHDAMDCGPACLKMIAKYYGKDYSLATLRHSTHINKDGVSLLGIKQAAEEIGLDTTGIKLNYKELVRHTPTPCILHWDQNHFVVLASVSQSFFTGVDKIRIADPGKDSLLSLDKEEFRQHWLGEMKDGRGTALLVKPTARFYEQEGEPDSKLSFGMIGKYIWAQQKLLWQLMAGLLIGILLQLAFPFLTQSIVDSGIAAKDLSFITVILFAQLMLFFSRMVVDFIRTRILLYISSRINLTILSDFWIKLMKLPLHFFDTKMTGDIMQRLGDHRRIENFLTGTLLNTLFSMLSLIVFSFVLLLYDPRIFSIYVAASLLYYGWIRIFLAKRRKLDYENFSLQARANSETLQLVQGMQEIKLNSADRLRRWKWEELQAGVFKLNFKKLSINQYQQAGTFFINEGKNILITYLVARAVINDELTIGAMMAVQYIIGQINSPVEQLIGLVQSAQDAKISLERLNEIHQMEDEEGSIVQTGMPPANKSICFENTSFTYAGAGKDPVLKNINLQIPEGKTTAIVGASGSGKTTLLKLLLKFYPHYTGVIKVGDANLHSISPSSWRSDCGAVMQDGFIFNDDIARNIAVNEETPDHNRLLQAARVANILAYVEGLSHGFDTKIGAEGNGISAGQRQRILIARVVYRNPHYIFFDEATNALDAKNEKIIIENLNDFFKNKTVVVVAHRLSTVRNADNIIVLENGTICEQGTHEYLVGLKGKYFELVRNQLELGN